MRQGREILQSKGKKVMENFFETETAAFLRFHLTFSSLKVKTLWPFSSFLFSFSCFIAPEKIKLQKINQSIL
jgi:hypothetical protein